MIQTNEIHSIFRFNRYCIGTVVAMLLNFILPEDVPISVAEKEPVEKAPEKNFVDDEA